MKQQRRSLPPSMAWLTVFLPAFSYFIATRFNVMRLWSRSSSLGTVVVDTIQGTDCSMLGEVFYTDCSHGSSTTISLRHALYLVQESGLRDVVSTVWKHDSELGRGYILLSQAHGSGRIWRWEVGNGPIPIGKTLHMDPSGCRSHKCNEGSAGSAGLAVDFFQQEQASEGRLVVAELGERRIVRMEESGARTPLVIQVPSLCSSTKSLQRITQPGHLLYTPFGDLVFTENQKDDCGRRGGILRLRNAMHIEPISSVAASREAHYWNTTLNHDEPVEILYQDGIDYVCGIALDTLWTGIYAVIVRDQSLLLLHLVLGNTDDEDDDTVSQDTQDTEMESLGRLDGKVRLVYNLTRHHDQSDGAGGALAVDRAGHVFVAVADGVAVLNEQGKLLGMLPTHQSPTSLTLGEDGFLYVSTQNQLLRTRVKAGPVKVPTNMVLKPSRKANNR